MERKSKKKKKTFPPIGLQQWQQFKKWAQYCHIRGIYSAEISGDLRLVETNILYLNLFYRCYCPQIRHHGPCLQVFTAISADSPCFKLINVKV